MLKQNWFQDKNFERFYEGVDGERYLDTENKCIYEVFATLNGTAIVQHDGSGADSAYPNLYADYEEWKYNQPKSYRVNVNTQFVVEADSYDEAVQIINEKLDKVGADVYRETYKGE